MIKKIVLISLVLIFFKAQSQSIVFKGIVYEHNSKTKTGQIKLISDAQVIIPRSVPVATDIKGKFKTVSEGLKLGSSVNFNIIKPGYEVVNLKEIENVIAGRLDDLIIYMAPKNELYKAQQEYYQIAKKSVETAYIKKINLLKSELTSLKIKNTDFENQIKNLEKERNSALSSAQEISKQLAEINLDFADTLLVKAVNLYRIGDVDGCLKILYSKEYRNEESQNNELLNEYQSGLTKVTRIIFNQIDKDFLLLKIYNSRLQKDSVELISNRIISTCFKNSDLLNCGFILKTVKKLAQFDQLNAFSWNNEDFYDDLISLAKIKSGRNSIELAEAYRLHGCKLMRENIKIESFNELKKSMTMISSLNNGDSILVLLNLAEHQLIFGKNEIYDPYLIFFNIGKTTAGNPIARNIYWLEYILKDANDIQYATRIVLEFESKFSRHKNGVTLCNFILRMVNDSKHRRSYGSDFINYIKITETFCKAKTKFSLSNNEISELVKLMSQSNKFTTEYVDILVNFSSYFIESIFNTKNYKKLDSENIYNTVTQNITLLNDDYFKNIVNYQTRFEIDFSKTSLLLIQTSFDSFQNSKVLAKEFVNLNRTWLKSANNNENLFNKYAFYMEIIDYSIVGCTYDIEAISVNFTDGNYNLRDIFQLLSKSLAYNNIYRGLELYKNFIMHSSNCIVVDDAILELLGSYSKVSELYSSYMHRPLFMINTESPFEDSTTNPYPKGAVYENVIKDYYFGSDFAIKVGKTGRVEYSDDWRIDKDFTNYDSLWDQFSKSSLNNDNDLSSELQRLISKNSFSIFLNNSTSISKIKFWGDPIVYGPIFKKMSTPAFCIYAFHGNRVLFNLDDIYNKLIWFYDGQGLYSKNIDLTNKFIDFGLLDFNLGYYNSSNNSPATISQLLFYGYKAALATKSNKNISGLEKEIVKFYSELSTLGKLQFCNEILYLSYNGNQTIIQNELSYLNLDNTLFNNFYKDLDSMLRKNSLIVHESEREDLFLESYLTLSGASNLTSYQSGIFEELESRYPAEARVFRNKALYYFRIGNTKLGYESLEKAISMGFENKSFFLDKVELKKYHSKISKCFSK